MIQGFSDYEKTEVKSFGDYEKLELGGHVCKILGVSLENFTSKKDGTIYTMLNIKFDISEPDEQAGFYQRKFVEDAKKDTNAKWKGNHRITVPNNQSADFIKSNWKTFVTSVEKSNPGVQLNGNTGFDENLLVGKLFGGVFGLEEFSLPTDGRTVTLTRIRFIRSTEKVKNSQIPNVKLLNGTYESYDDYMERKEENSNKNISNSSNMTNNDWDNDSLPF